MRIQTTLLALLLGTASAVAQSQPAPPPFPSQVAPSAITPAPSEVIDFCEFAPLEIGTKCLEALDGWERGGVDPTISARSIQPSEGDTIIASPDWSAALIIRETVRGVRTAAWPNGKSSEWLADIYSPDMVIASAEGVVITEPDNGVEVNAEIDGTNSVDVAAAAPATAPDPVPAASAPKMTEGWIADVKNDQGIALASYYDNDASWFQSDASRVMPVDDASDEFTFVRRSKMLISEDAEYTFGFTVTAPDVNEITQQMGGSNYWDDLIRDLNLTAVCSVEFSVNGSPVIRKSGELALVKGSMLQFAGVTAGIQKGVYDASITVDCNWADARIQASRRALAKHTKADITAISFGFDFKATSESGNVRFAVDADSLTNAYKSAQAPAKMIAPSPKLPEGFNSGWVVEAHPADSSEADWPISPGAFQAVAKPGGLRVNEYASARSQKKGLVIKTLYTPEETGTYVFALAPTLSPVNTDAYADDKPLGWRQEAIFRIEDIIFPTQPLRADRSNLMGIDQFGHSVGISAVEAELQAGITYNIGVYLPDRGSIYAPCAHPRDCEILFNENGKGRKLPGDEIRFLIRTPKDPGLRSFGATEALHRIADGGKE
jgi:hypothetical protein